MEITWDVPPEQMLEQVAAAYVKAIRAGVEAIAKRRAPVITQWMKENHPWQNRTGAAESGLHTEVEVEEWLVELLLQHTVEYGWYLEGFNPAAQREMANGGRWAVLAPAVDAFGPILMSDLRQLLGG